MDVDQEILARLTNTEDYFTERKTTPHVDDCRNAMIAFANSALPNKPGILYLGVENNGNIVGNLAGNDKGSESWQNKVGKWANGCFPPIQIITRALSKDQKEFLAVVVPLSPDRPHFVGPAYKRIPGPATVKVDQSAIDSWIAYRSSKVRLILDSKGRQVAVEIRRTSMNTLGDVRGIHTVMDCNEHFVTLEKLSSNRIVTHPMSTIELKMNDGKPNPPGELMLLLTPY